MLRDWGIAPPSDPSSSSLTQCVRRFGVPHPTTPHKGEISHHIVAAKLSPDNPRDLLLSYSSAGIYLFDTDGETYERPPPPPRPSKGKKGKKRAEDDSDRVEEDEADDGAATGPEKTNASESREAKSSTPATAVPFGAHEHKRSAKKRAAGRSAESSTAELPQKRPRDEGREEVDVGGGPMGESSGQCSTTGVVEPEQEVLREEEETGGEAEESEDSSDEEELMEDSDGEGDTHTDGGENEGGSEDATGGEDGDEEEGDFLPRGRGRQYHVDVPMIAPRQSYTGHANTQVRFDDFRVCLGRP